MPIVGCVLFMNLHVFPEIPVRGGAEVQWFACENVMGVRNTNLQLDLGVLLLTSTNCSYRLDCSLEVG
jgi:hypothetical protein